MDFVLLRAWFTSLSLLLTQNAKPKTFLYRPFRANLKSLFYLAFIRVYSRLKFFNSLFTIHDTLLTIFTFRELRGIISFLLFLWI